MKDESDSPDSSFRLSGCSSSVTRTVPPAIGVRDANSHFVIDEGKPILRAAFGASLQQRGRDGWPILMQQGRRQAKQPGRAQPGLGSFGIGGRQPIKGRHGLRPRLARGMPVGLGGGQGGLHARVVRVELGQCFVQPQVFGQHPDAALEVGVGMEQESQFFGGPVGIVPDDRHGGPECGASPPSGKQVPAFRGKRE